MDSMDVFLIVLVIGIQLSFLVIALLDWLKHRD